MDCVLGPKFFRFNGWDWGIAGLIAAGLWGLNSILLDNKTAEVRVDFAHMEERVGASLDGMKKDLDDHQAEIRTLVADGMKERTGEIADALIAGLKGTAKWYYVQVAAVPVQSAQYNRLRQYASTFDQPKMMQAGDTAAFEFWVPTLDDQRADTLQSLLFQVKDVGAQASVSLTEAPAMRAISQGFKPRLPDPEQR